MHLNQPCDPPSPLLLLENNDCRRGGSVDGLTFQVVGESSSIEEANIGVFSACDLGMGHVTLRVPASSILVPSRGYNTPLGNSLLRLCQTSGIDATAALKKKMTTFLALALLDARENIERGAEESCSEVPPAHAASLPSDHDLADMPVFWSDNGVAALRRCSSRGFHAYSREIEAWKKEYSDLSEILSSQEEGAEELEAPPSGTALPSAKTNGFGRAQ